MDPGELRDEVGRARDAAVTPERIELVFAAEQKQETGEAGGEVGLPGFFIATICAGPSTCGEMSTLFGRRRRNWLLPPCSLTLAGGRERRHFWPTKWALQAKPGKSRDYLQRSSPCVGDTQASHQLHVVFPANKARLPPGNGSLRKLLPLSEVHPSSARQRALPKLAANRYLRLSSPPWAIMPFSSRATLSMPPATLGRSTRAHATKAMRRRSWPISPKCHLALMHAHRYLQALRGMPWDRQREKRASCVMHKNSPRDDMQWLDSSDKR